MRIAFILNQFPKLSETFILRQITGMIDRGHDVTVFAEYSDSVGQAHDEVTQYRLMEHARFVNAPEESVLQELPVWPIVERTWSPVTGRPTWNAIRILEAMPKLGRCLATHPMLTCEVLSGKQYGYQARSFSSLYRLASLASARQRFDVLHAHFGPIGQSFRFARKLWNAPLVVSFHGYDFSTWPKRQGTAAYRQLFSVVDVVTAHTQFAEQRLRGLGCPEDSIRRLACGVNLDEFAFRLRERSASEPTRILTVGRLVEKKGIEFAIRAIAQLIEEGNAIRYTVLGGGPLKSELRQLIKALGVQDYISLKGACDGVEVRRQIQRAHLFLLPSVTAADGDTEGAPVSIMEAQACGLPVVSTIHAGIPEILEDGVSGFLVPERDVPALVSTLRQLIEHPEDWGAIGTRGRAFVQQHHDIIKLNDNLDEIYSEAIASFQSQQPIISRPAS